MPGLKPLLQAGRQVQALPLTPGLSSLVKVAHLQKEFVPNNPHLLFTQHRVPALAGTQKRC